MPEDIEAFKEQKEELSLPSWSSGLLGFEVLLLDLNQHGAEPLLIALTHISRTRSATDLPLANPQKHHFLPWI